MIAPGDPRRLDKEDYCLNGRRISKEVSSSKSESGEQTSGFTDGGRLTQTAGAFTVSVRVAFQREYRPKQRPNPLRETTVPKAPGSIETYAYDLETIREIIGLVPENCKVVIALAGYAGLSKSEIQGLVWEGYNGREIAVLSSVVNGKRGDPKTDARKDSIPLIDPVRKMLDMHRLKMGNPATGVMFPTKKKKAPLPSQSVLGLHPACA